MKKYSIYSTILIIGLLFACKKDFEGYSGSKGSADFTTVVFIGNSLTSGYADNALSREGQINSFPAIIADRLNTVGGALNFKQPLMPEGVGFGSSMNARYELTFTKDCKGSLGIGPMPVALTGDMSILNPATYVGKEGPFNNMGVPGMKSFHIGLKSYGDPSGISMGTANPFFARMATKPGEVSILDDVMKLNPTFFTMWLGNNDVLGYAVAGGEGNVGGTGGTDITPLSVFDATYNMVIDSLTKNGAKGVLLSIPDITSVPFFTTVPANGLTLDQANANVLMAAYANYNAGAKSMGLPEMSFKEGKNYFVIQDMDPKYNPLGNIRQLKAGELLVLTTPQDSIKCAGYGSQKPLGKQYVLDETEIATIKSNTEAFNATIKKYADMKGLAYLDMNSVLAELKKGIIYDNVTYTATFVTGGAFSLDGVHLNQRGYAIVANQIISKINSTYGSSIPSAEVNQYQGTKFP